jgi:hypothetical protein
MRRIAATGALLGAFALAACSRRAAPEDAARQFFELIQSGKAAEAYQSATFAFRQQQTVSYFETVLHQLGLDRIQSAKYGGPEWGDNRQLARVSAELTTGSKSTLAAVISLIPDEGRWRVLSIKSPRDRVTGAVQDWFTFVGHTPVFVDPTRDHAPPAPAAAAVLASDALLAFNQAVHQKSFLDLFDLCALRWQDQLARPDQPAVMPGKRREPLTAQERELGAGRLQHAFEGFVEQQIDIGGIAGIQPIFDRAPWVNTEGLLVLSGYYPTKPYRVVFSLRYCFELPEWRLFGLDVRFAKDERS